MRPFLLVFALGTLLAGCLKAGPPVTAAERVPVVLAAVRTALETNAPVAVPEDVTDALEDVIEAHNLTAVVVPDAELSGLFGDGRSSVHRVERLVARAGDAGLAVLVETESRYVSQVAGRYRWEVAVTLTVADPGHIEEALVRTFTVPVFVQFYRQREDEAVGLAQPNIARRLGELLDEALRNHQHQGG